LQYMEETPIINRVAQSGIITLNLEEYLPKELVAFDMKDHLFQGLILREKDLRAFIKEHDWESYRGKAVALFCSADAIVPTWAYMLVANRLSGIAADVQFATPDAMRSNAVLKALHSLDPEEFRDKRVVIKGCGDDAVPMDAYVQVTRILSPVVKSLMYGEPCSTVPIFKRK
jgi:hypothetical protein